MMDSQQACSVKCDSTAYESVYQYALGKCIRKCRTKCNSCH
jgi:hypothetical protein